MPSSERHDRTRHREGDFPDRVGRKARRRLRARAEDEGIWFWLGMFGLVGWSVAIPTLAGIALGAWIDRVWPGDISWTLTLLFIGVVAGCFNAWQWVQRERHRGERDR